MQQASATDSDSESGSAVVDIARCAMSGELRPIDELLPYGDSWVAPEHSDAFVEQVIEGADPSKVTPYSSTRLRALGLVIDYLIKLVPVTLVHMPYFIAAAELSEKIEVTAPENFASLVSVSFVAAWLGAKVAHFLISSIYETWMVGRYGATLGKMAVGARVVMPDGARVTYPRAALRWAAKTMLNGFIFWAILGVPLFLAALLIGFSTARGIDMTAILPLAIWVVVAVGVVFFPLSLFPYWMAIGDREKRSLHDRVASTRVVDAVQEANEEGEER